MREPSIAHEHTDVADFADVERVEENQVTGQKLVDTYRSPGTKLIARDSRQVDRKGLDIHTFCEPRAVGACSARRDSPHVRRSEPGLNRSFEPASITFDQLADVAT